jgi:hypothetical protein
LKTSEKFLEEACKSLNFFDWLIIARVSEIWP